MSKLVIVESPAKAKTIGKYLGSDYEVTASMGHIRDLPASQLGIDVEHGYTPQYISIKGKEKLIKELKSKAKHSDGVLLATDPDREGEAISWHLANILGLDPHEPNRVTFDEITKKGVQEGMAHPRAIDEDLFNAQQARRVLDRLVGYKLSPFLWRKVRRGLSAGRVQSVAVRQMVCNDFLDRFRCSFRIDFADSGHNKTLPFTFLFDELPVSYTHLHTMSIGILLFAAIFQQKVIRRVVFCTPVSYFRLLIQHPRPALHCGRTPGRDTAPTVYSCTGLSPSVHRPVPLVLRWSFCILLFL